MPLLLWLLLLLLLLWSILIIKISSVSKSGNTRDLIGIIEKRMVRHDVSGSETSCSIDCGLSYAKCTVRESNAETSQSSTELP